MRKIVICGSMSHEHLMYSIAETLKEEGYEVISPRLTDDEKQGETLTDEQKQEMIREYLEFIKNADSIVVVNEEKNGVQGYIGGNTLVEMSVAFFLNKKIYLWREPSKEQFGHTEIMAMQPTILYGRLQQLELHPTR